MTAPVKLRVAIGPSRILAAALAIAHLAALGVALVVTLPAWASLLIATTIMVSCASSILRLALQRSSNAIVELEAGEGAHVSCRTRDGQWRQGQALSSSFISPWLTVLSLRVAGAARARHLVILPDNVETEAFRRLRVLLRWSPEGTGLPQETPR